MSESERFDDEGTPREIFDGDHGEQFRSADYLRAIFTRDFDACIEGYERHIYEMGRREGGLVSPFQMMIPFPYQVSYIDYRFGIVLAWDGQHILAPSRLQQIERMVRAVLLCERAIYLNIHVPLRADQLASLLAMREGGQG